jgi:hypothetical protein
MVPAIGLKALREWNSLLRGVSVVLSDGDEATK